MKTPRRFMKMLLTCTAIVFTLSQCSSDDPSPAKKPADVYVAGSFNTLSAPAYNWVPAYWKNGEMVQLADANGEAKAIAVIGDDVYVIGKLDSNDKQLVLWTNGMKTDLTDGMYYDYVYGMKVFGNDWYAIGTAYVAGVGERAAYWKNGVVHVINSERQSNGYDITVDGDNVYVVGREVHESGYDMAKIWKNDEGTDLTDGAHYGGAYGVAVYNGDVYVSGQDASVIKLWKNEELSSIEFETEGTYGANAGNLLVIDGDVYVSGSETDGSDYTAKIWKNGAIINVSTPASATETYGYNLIIAGKDIFMLGEGNVTAGNEFSTIVWKNGEVTDSYDGTNLMHAYSIFVAMP